LRERGAKLCSKQLQIIEWRGTMSLKYPRRTNPDGTIDSICPRCYVTIGTSVEKADLKRLEDAHVCDPARLSYFEEQGKRKPVESVEPQSGPSWQAGKDAGRS
jgi:hypothetical protein